jgi:hypothetical protein
MAPVFRPLARFRVRGTLLPIMGNEVNPGFFARLGLALKVLGDAGLAGKIQELVSKPEAKMQKEPVAPKPVAQEKAHASGLFVLSVLQQDGRLVDFLQQDVTGFSDEEVGSAARVVHTGCRKALNTLVTVVPALKDAEGSRVTVPAGFDANRIRVTGNVTGQPPFTGSLRHHGWVATEVKFPTLSDSIDYRVIAPSEVEL